MKKSLFLLPLTLFFLVGCNNGGTTPTVDTSGTSNNDGSATSTSAGNTTSEEDEAAGHDIRIKFYLDYNHYDKDNPYHSVWWDSDTTFTKEQIGLVDPTEAPDPYYPTFLGWSKYAVVDEDSRLWNFGVDKISYDETAGGTFEIFGIFVRR